MGNKTFIRRSQYRHCLMLKILMVHNHLRPPSGENVVFENEKQLLLEKGHEVVTYERRNEETEAYSFASKALLAWKVTWAGDSFRDISAIIDKYNPDVTHFHGTFPLISPAAYWACFNKKIPGIQTLHNFRLICPGALLFRNERICEECVRGSLWHGAAHGCYNQSRLMTGIVTQMILTHRLLKTWDKVTLYIALNEFCKSIFIKGGFDGDRICVKPNFIYSDLRPEYNHKGYALFIGRLGPEKGLDTLLNAWNLAEGVPLRIVGEGPMRGELEDMARKLDLVDVTFPGYLPHDECCELIKHSRFVLVPSEGYETFNLVVREAFAQGKPVIASRLGVLDEAVAEGVTGLKFEPGNYRELAQKVKWMISHERESVEMGKNARAEFEEKYTPEKNYGTLIDIYKKAIEMNEARYEK